MRSAVSTSAFRQAARTRRLPTQYSRFASSNAETAQKKTQDALGSAQKTAEKLWESSKKFLGPLGERAGSMLGCMSFREHLHFADTDVLCLCSAYRQPVMYNLSVARELLKQVYVAERLQPPTDFAAVRSAYSTLWSRASSQAYWRGILSSGEWAKVAIYAVEAYGIFKVCLILVYDVTVVNY